MKETQYPAHPAPEPPPAPAPESKLPLLRPPARAHPQGFSLIEVLLAFALLTVAAGALLHNLALSYRYYGSARDDWKVGLELWNRAARLRAGVEAAPGERIQPAQPGIPLQQIRLTIETGGRRITWEVLHGKR